MMRGALVSTALLFAFGSEARAGGDLVGLWTASTEGVTVHCLFLPSGRYLLSLAMDGVSPLEETGRYALKDGELSLTNRAGSVSRYHFARSGPSATWSGGALRSELVFSRDPDSPAKVEAKAKALEAQAAKEDAEWKKKLRLASPVAMPGFAIEGAPPDPKDGKSSTEGRCFAELQLYAHWPEPHVLDVLGLEPRQSGGDTTYCTFLPNGRVLETVEPDILAKAPAGPKKAAWGSYSVKGDRIAIQMDGGKEVEIPLLDGGRTLTRASSSGSQTFAVVGRGDGNAASDDDAPMPSRSHDNAQAAGPRALTVPSPSAKEPAKGRSKTRAEEDLEDLMKEMRAKAGATKRSR